MNARTVGGAKRHSPPSEREQGEPARCKGIATALIGRGVQLKVCALLTVLFMLSTAFGSVGHHELRVRISAAPGVFSTPVMVNDNRLNEQGNPVLVPVPKDGLFAVWQDTRSGSEDIFTAKSSNNGTSFSVNKRADDSIGLSKQIDPAVAIANDGTIYLVWQDNRRSTFDFDIYFTKSVDGGQTFSKNIRVDDPTVSLSWQERPSIAVTGNGIVFVAWTDDRGGAFRIRGAYSVDGGATFSSSKELVATGSTSGQDEVSLIVSGNRIFASYMDNLSGVPHPYVVVSTNGGKTFSTATRLDDTGTPGIAQKGVKIAPMPGGGIAAAWEDNRSGNWDIYMSILSSHMTAITPNIRADDDFSGAFQSTPSISADQLGNVYVAWLDERDYLYAVRFAYLIAGTTAFNSSVAVSLPGPNDVQRMPSVAVSQPGIVFVAWQDDRLTNYDIYCSSAYFPDLLGLSLNDGWNLISIPSDVIGLKASTIGLKTGDVVSSWNSTSQRFDNLYVVGISPPIVDFNLAPSSGYWISTGSHETIKLKNPIPTTRQSRHLAVPAGGGWVAIGFESLNTSRYASDIAKMVDVPGVVSTVAGYDSFTRAYEQYAAGIPFTDFVLTPGQAYWCWLTSSANLTYTP